jgi:hypothetical protein
MSKLHLLLLGLFISAAAIVFAAAVPLQYDKKVSKVSETATHAAAGAVLSDPRICLTNILMTYFRHALRLRSPITRRLTHSQRI